MGTVKDDGIVLYKSTGDIEFKGILITQDEFKEISDLVQMWQNWNNRNQPHPQVYPPSGIFTR